MNAQWLVAAVAGIRVAIPLDQVQEVVERGALTLLPRLPPMVPGVLESQGRAIPLIDLGAVCGSAPRHDRRNAVIANAGVHTLAFLVDDVDGIQNAEDLGPEVRLLDSSAVLASIA